MEFTVVILVKFLNNEIARSENFGPDSRYGRTTLGRADTKIRQKTAPKMTIYISKIKRQHCALHIQTKALGKLYCAANNNWSLLLIFTEELDVVLILC